MGSCQLPRVQRGVLHPCGLEAGDVRGCAVERLAVGHADAEGAGGLGAAVGWEGAGDGEGLVLVGLVVEVHASAPIDGGQARQHRSHVHESCATSARSSRKHSGHVGAEHRSHACWARTVW
ncbi:MAG: hypothetical protein BGP03_33335 [Pseudonocardia sp. 73-21]|nr:MAG: hypothetical protein BGP03_33335 [Pseudonocardia sp. 73-21]